MPIRSYNFTNVLKIVVEEFIDFVYNKCDEPEYSNNEICLKCKPVEVTDFYTLMKMVFDARI